MSVARCALGAAGTLARLAGAVARPLGLGADRLRVALYHDVPVRCRESFAAHLRRLGRSWTFVSPERFSAFAAGHEPVRGRNLLLTFDDGYASNRAVAEEILAPMGIRALFFAVPEFASAPSRAAAREFITRRILPGWHEAALDPDLANLRWSDLEALLEQGHAVGAHTMSHARLADLSTPAALAGEIVGSGDMLAARLGVPVEHFAYPFGDLPSMSPAGLAIAAGRFAFVHSGLRGDNRRVSPFAIRRDSLAPSEPLSVVDAFVEGVADPYYARSRARLDEWAGGLREVAR